MTPASTPGIVLAAGSSSRLGRPKQLELLGGERLLERAVRLAGEAGCAPVVVVLGCESGRVEAECNLRDAAVVVNGDWPSGMASSLRVGIAALPPDASGALVLACDQVAVTAGHLRMLAERGTGTAGAVASLYGGRRGVPAYFPAGSFPALLRLGGDVGARDLLADADAVALPGGELDVDTEELLMLARSLHEPS